MTVVWDPEKAELRARHLLDATSYLEDVGLGRLGAEARMVARDALEAIDMLRAERSARLAIQARRDELVDLLGRRAEDAVADFQ